MTPPPRTAQTDPPHPAAPAVIVVCASCSVSEVVRADDDTVPAQLHTFRHAHHGHRLLLDLKDEQPRDHRRPLRTRRIAPRLRGTALRLARS